MNGDSQKKLIAGCAIGGGALLTLGDLVVSNFYAMRHAGELGAAGAVGSGISVAGTAFLGAILGAFIACIIILIVPKERMSCVKCGSQTAIKAYKSIWDGKERPNRCPECKHEWS